MSRDLNDTLIFVKVVEHGSFISAARALRLPKTTVSRKVQDLETRLGAQLLHRTTRKLGLTEAGKRLLRTSQRISPNSRQPTAPSASCSVPARLAALQPPRTPSARQDRAAARRVPRAAPGRARGHDADQRAARSHRYRTRPRAAPGPPARFRPGGAQAGRAAHAGVRQRALHRTAREPLHPDDLQHHRTLAMQKHRRNNGGYCWTLNAARAISRSRRPRCCGKRSRGAQGRVAVRRWRDARADVMVKPYADKGLVRRVLAG